MFSLQTDGWLRPVPQSCVFYDTVGSSAWQKKSEPGPTSSPLLCQTQTPVIEAYG